MSLYSKQKMHGHAVSTLRTLNVCRKSNFLCDFTILVNNKAFRLHRVVLASCSEYFNAMFSHDTKELREGYAKMSDLDTEAVRQCIEFMYTGEASPTLESAQPILHASCLLHLDGLTELCFEKLMNEINLKNCLFIKHIGQTYASKELEKAADEFVLRNFESVVQDKNFIDLRLEDLVAYLTSSEIQISSVVSLWSTAMKWIEADKKMRKRFFCELLQHLKLSHCPVDFIRQTVWENALVQESNLCKSSVAHSIFKQVLDKEKHDVVNLHSCLFIKNLGKIYSCKDVEEVADKFVLENFDDVINDKAFLRLGKDDVIRYIKSPDIRYSSEVNLWKAVLTWVKHDWSQRRKLFAEMMQHVKLDKMPADFLQNTVRNEPMVRSSEMCKDMLMDALFRQVTKDKKQGIAVIDRSSKVMKSYEPSSGQWHDLENVKMGFSFTESCVFALVIDDFLYVLIKKLLYKISWKEDNSEWSEMASMNIKRDLGPSIATLGRYIYIVDGRSVPVTERGDALSFSKANRSYRKSSGNQEVHLHSCGEYYDTLLNSWTHVTVMPTLRASCCLATNDDIMYLMGGKMQSRKETNWLGMDMPTNIVECYDPISKDWTSSPPMISARYDASSAVLNGKIFVMGGVGTQGRLKEVEVFDSVTKTWSAVEGMTVGRSFFSACVVDGSIYVVGGDYRKDAYDKTIEVFDSHKRKWEVVKKLNMKIYDNAAVVIKNL